MGKNVVVIGTQWGDEGKGKLVDLLTERADAVVQHAHALALEAAQDRIDAALRRLASAGCRPLIKANAQLPPPHAAVWVCGRSRTPRTTSVAPKERARACRVCASRLSCQWATAPAPSVSTTSPARTSSRRRAGSPPRRAR